jgi:hypothetical protein
MLSTSNDRLKLSDWANAYERERGQIVTPKREEKRHSQEWRDLSANNKAARDRVYADTAAAMKEAAARHKAECKPIWATYFRDARAAEKAFATREQSIAGVIRNAMDATAHQKVSGQLGNRGALSATFGNVLSSQMRARAFAERQDLNRQQMAARLKLVLEHEIQGIKAQRARDLAGQRGAFDQACASLIERQDIERGKVREAWKQIYGDRARDRSADRDQHRARMLTRNAIRSPNNQAREKWNDRRAERAAWKAREAQQDATPVQEQKPMKDRFETVRRLDKPAPTPTKQAYISQAQPAPSPSGDAPKPAPKRLQEVPQKKQELPAVQRLADAKRDWTPAAQKPARDPQRDFRSSSQEGSRPVKDAAYWQERGKQAQAQERARPARDRDREPER